MSPSLQHTQQPLLYALFPPTHNCIGKIQTNVKNLVVLSKSNLMINFDGSSPEEIIFFK